MIASNGGVNWGLGLVSLVVLLQEPITLLPSIIRLNQELITRSLHLPYKPLELTLSRFNFFRIETAFAEYCSLKQYPVRILLLVIFEGEKDRLTLLFEIMDSLRLRSTERKIDSVRNYFSCWLFVRCFEWLFNQVFLKAIVCLMWADWN